MAQMPATRNTAGSSRRLLLDPTLIACSVLLNLMAVALPIYTLQVYDRVLPNAANDTLLLLTILLLTVLFGEGAMRAIRSALSTWAGARFEHGAGCAGIAQLLGADIRASGKDTTGTHLERLGAIDRLREFYANQGAIIVIDLPFALLFTVIIWIIGGPLAWLTVLVFVVFAIAAAIIGRVLHEAIDARTDSDRRRTSFMIEILSGITTIKAMTMERLMMRRYERLMDNASANAFRVTYLSALSQALGTFFSNLAIVAILIYGSLLVLNHEMTVGQLACCSLLAGRVMQPLLRAMGIWSNFQAIRLAERQLAQLHAMPQEPGGLQRPTRIVTEGRIEFRDVSVDDGIGQPLLDHANLTIHAGETVALVGSDSGDRSAILSLIAGLQRPTGGQIIYDGKALKDSEPRPGPDEIGLLPRLATVFQGSMIDNLTMFRRGAVVDTALQLAERLALDSYIATLANGYETTVSGGQTETLPGGVRQRIAIIRALVEQPRVILFDESNNGFDRNSNERLIRMLADMKGKATIILVSYQPSVLRLADRVFELRDGKLIERPAFSAMPADIAPADALGGQPT
jgi:ATP-binding cassette subfamily C protein LapB